MGEQWHCTGIKMKFLVFAAILVVGQATKVKIHVPQEAAALLEDLTIDDIPQKIRVHLKDEKATKMANDHLHGIIDNCLADMKVNDPELHEIYTTDDRADEFEEKRSVHEIAKEKFLADLKVSAPELHDIYTSLPADQQDAFLGDLFNGIGHAVKGVASIATGAVGLVGGAVHGAVKGVVDIGHHVVKGATEGCKSGILECVGGAIGGTVKGAGNVVVSTLGGAHKGSEAGLNIFDKKHPAKPKCAADTIAACGGYAAKGYCTVNA